MDTISNSIDKFENWGITSIPENKVQFPRNFNYPIQISLTTTTSKISQVAKQFAYREYLSKTEKKLLYKAVNSLIIKSEFLQLNLRLLEKQINEDEFYEEIEKNNYKYINELNPLDSEEELIVMDKILKNLNRDYTVDEVAELFSYTPESINNKAIELSE